MNENPEDISGPKIETERKNPVNVLILIDKFKELGDENEEALQMFRDWYDFECATATLEKDPVKFAVLQVWVMIKQIDILLASNLPVQAYNVLKDAFDYANNLPESKESEEVKNSLGEMDRRLAEALKNK